MLLIQCDKCGEKFWVKGYTTPDCWTDPGEVVTELECDDELCPCLKDGESFGVLEESCFGDFLND